MEGGGGDGNSVPLNKNRDTTTTTTSTTSTSTTLTSSTTGSSTTNSTADTTNDRNSIVAISSTNNISIATTEDAVDNTPPGTNNNNSSCRVQFNTTPNVVEIPVYEIPSVHFETNVGAADPLAFSFSSIDNCTTNPPIHLNLAALSLASSDKDVVLPYRKLDSPPPTPKALESISPAPIPSSSANARLLLIPTEEGDEGPEGEDGHVCFAPTLTTVLPPGREEHAVHFCRPSPDDLLDHDGPHRNLESPPPPPEIVNMIKSPSVSGDGNDENEYATKNTTDDSEYNENGEPHVHFSAAPQVVEFFPVESAHVHFSNDNNSNPAEEDADNQNNVDNDHDVSPHPHRKLESPPPPLEDADHRLSPTPSDSSSKKQQSLLLPIVPNDDGIAEEDDRDSTGPRVHFSTSVFVEDTSQNAAQQQVEKDPQPPVLRVVQFAESNLPTSGGDGGTAQNQRFVSPPPPPLVQQPHDAIQINGGSSEIELLLDQVEITQVVESDRVHIAAQVSNYVGPERTNYVGPERMTSTSNSVQAMPSGHAPSDAELGRSYESRSSSLTMSTTNVTEIKKSPDSSSAGRILSSTSSSGNSDGLHLTSSLRSSGETSAGKKFSSKDLRGNLTRRQIDRDPLEIYEITAMLGEGSMGSVAKVRKRPLAVGGSSRKNPEVFETTVVTHITPLVHHPCFNLPFFGSLFRDCFNGTESPLNDSSRHSKEEVALLLDSTETVSSAEIIYAMKSIHLDRCTDLTLIEELKNEVEMLKTLDHPHIVKAIETFEFRNQLFVTMELCSGGDLYSHDPYTEEEAARITMAILSAVSYMHSKGV